MRALAEKQIRVGHWLQPRALNLRREMLSTELNRRIQRSDEHFGNQRGLVN